MTSDPTALEVSGQTLRINDSGPSSTDPGDKAWPAILYVHGAGGFADVPLIGRLTGSYRVVAVELPGVGRTRAGGASSMRELGRLLAGAITSLDIEGCAVVTEPAMARAALWLAVDAPGRIGHLALLSPAALLGPGQRVPTVPPALLVRSSQTNAAPIDFTVGNALEERFLRRVFGELWDTELEKALATVTTPTLVVRGTDDYLDAGDQDRTIASALPNGHRILIYDAGPCVGYERPEAVSMLLDDFIRYGDKFLYDHASTVIAP